MKQLLYKLFFTAVLIQSISADSVVLDQPELEQNKQLITEQLITEQSITEVERADKISRISTGAVIHLDEISSILQYLGQAVNKGTIKFSDKLKKEEIQEWVVKHQNVITHLKQDNSFYISEVKLNNLLYNIKLLALHIQNSILNKFTKLSDFESEILRTNSESLEKQKLLLQIIKNLLFKFMKMLQKQDYLGQI